MWQKYNPAVPKHFLFFIACIVWVCIGTLLCMRAIGWLTELSVFSGMQCAGAGFVLSFLGYRFGVSKIVRRNVHRIHNLIDNVCCFAFTPLRGYAMIAVMISLGYFLRHLSLPHYSLSILYIAMGGALFAGSVQFFREFNSITLTRKQ